MTVCDTVKKQLTNYLDHSLDTPSLNEIEQHLAGCATCNRVFNDSKLISKQLHFLQPVKASDDFMPRLRQQIRESNTSKKTKPLFSIRNIGYSLSAAAVLVLTYVTISSDFTTIDGGPEPLINTSSETRQLIDDSQSPAAKMINQQELTNSDTDSLLNNENIQDGQLNLIEQ